VTKKILWIGDGVTSTGFSTVNNNIIGNLPKEEFDVHHLAINYYGDPHDFNWKIYPAFTKGNVLGLNRIPDFANFEWDGIFILNDPWVINKFLEQIKKHFKKIPPIVTYFPVDATELSKEWFEHFDIVSESVLYTLFGAMETLKVHQPKSGLISVIPHGVDTTSFYKIEDDKRKIKKLLFPDKEDFLDSFIVLNNNRNQPRKRIDITIKGFSLFAQNKPENVKLYLHMGLTDVGWNVSKLAERYGIANRLVVTGTQKGPQQVPVEKLNIIYNATDVGLNTSIGEGWGLANHEHSATGKPQIVPDHSACRELFEDCGLLIPANITHVNPEVLTEGKVVTPEDVALKLEEIYSNKDLYDTLANKCYTKFTSLEFTWSNIVETKWLPLFREVFNG